MAEAVKVALIRDRSFFDWIEDNVASLARFDPAPLDHLIERSATLHMSQIAKGGDPFETGSSRPLDFGHWAAHKLEMLTRHALSHGEAVAIGMALDARYSVLSGLLSESDCKRVCDVLEALGFALWHDALALRGADGELEVLTGLREFQEHLGGELTITLLSGIGTGVDVHAVRRDLVQSAATWLCEREV
jgi:3-dehydroquinate synthase